ncbi:nickel-dependent hydrogenase large subunit [Candidatus Accumulibacter sp. ACC003]|uniref:nickel-dependent hydrogenase large subunit n=1 Tax=Candidatus Accumulibacter sp. ACC003 TaxID=2823334 RepID=UPI0025C0E3B9|nr:nickel-dependent hydrogenase large subunit [Candidatus Accumulibacter sp. ACC003]
MEQGVLQLTLSWDRRQIVAAGVVSTRPAAARALRGLPVARVLEVVPRVFSICRCAQEAAARLACYAARGQRPAPALSAVLARAVACEAIGEHLWRLLLDCPQLCAQPVRQSEFLSWRKGLLAVVDEATAAAFGARLAAWLDDEKLPLADARTTHAAVPLLPCLTAAEWRAHLVAAAVVGLPTFAGQVAETGALARHAEDRAVAALLNGGQRLQARLAARYADLRWLAQGLVEPARLATWLDAAELAEGGGLARVETARGTLLHAIELAGERVARYVIVAPTEWNFHPQGAFVHEIRGRAARTRAEAEQAARRVALSLDPCVPCEVLVKELEDA